MCYSKPVEERGKARGLSRLEVVGGGVTLSFREGGVSWWCCETERHLCNLALCISTSE